MILCKMQCSSCAKMFIGFIYCKNTLIFKNSRKQIFKLTRLIHFRHQKQNEVKSSLKLDTEKNIVSNFFNNMEVRLKQARQSVLVQLDSDKSFSKFSHFCSSLGEVNHIYNYTLPNTKLYFSLVEFKNMESLSEIQLRCSGSTWKSPTLPYMSPFLLFHNLPENDSSTNKDDALISDYGLLPNDEKIAYSLSGMETVSDQIMKLHEVTRLNDLGIRLRFLTAFQVESALSGIFPGSHCLLFGSSVNGCGRLNSDLDLVLNVNNEMENIHFDGQLRHQTKSNFLNDRAKLKKHLEVLADILHNFLPGCQNVIRILQARVPIIKYKHEYTAVDCDLSLTNNNAVTMSNLVYTLSSIDWRVRPLLLTVKHWADKNNVTSPFPGRWISNFSLSLLVIFYMQQLHIIPSINSCAVLKSVSDKESDNDVTCIFMYDSIQTFINNNHNEISLSELLLGFFEYYLKFDFDSLAISLNSGQTFIKKNVYEAMHIVNPLEQDLNVSKNVSFEELTSLKVKLSDAIGLLSSQLMNERDRTSEWGLIPLLKDSASQKKRFNFKTQTRTRLVNVKELFSDSGNN